jgi:hypothetical protein
MTASVFSIRVNQYGCLALEMKYLRSSKLREPQDLNLLQNCFETSYRTLFRGRLL